MEKILFLVAIALLAGGIKADSDDELLNWEAPEDMTEDCPYYLLNREKDSPIWLIPFGTWKTSKYLSGPRRQELSKYVDQGVARATVSGRNTTGYMMIVDMDTYKGGLLNPKFLFFVEKVGAVLKVVTGKDMKHFWLINGDSLLVTLVRTVKILQHEKIEAFLNTEFEKAKESMAKMISPENLIKKFGGTAEFNPAEVYG